MTPIERVREALERGRTAENRCLLNKYYSVMPSMSEALQPYEEALSELDGMVLVPVESVEDVKALCASVNRDFYMGEEAEKMLVYKIRVNMIAPYVEGEKE